METNKTLKEVYKNSSDEVREILRTKFSNEELGIKNIEEEIKNEFLEILWKYSKNIRFLDSVGIITNLPSPRFEILNENDEWLFDISYEENNKHFLYSQKRILNFFEKKYNYNFLMDNTIIKSIINDYLNLKEIKPASSLKYHYDCG